MLSTILIEHERLKSRGDLGRPQDYDRRSQSCRRYRGYALGNKCATWQTNGASSAFYFQSELNSVCTKERMEAVHFHLQHSTYICWLLKVISIEHEVVNKSIFILARQLLEIALHTGIKIQY